jgi:hypothetical protein
MASSPFCIVHFVDTRTVEAVPTCWTYKVNDDWKCYWPPGVGAAAVVSAVQSKMVPLDTWKSYKCKILKYFGEHIISYCVA